MQNVKITASLPGGNEETSEQNIASQEHQETVTPETKQASEENSESEKQETETSGKN